jgi:putative nucleotidyltransferase with HDIG domain
MKPAQQSEYIEPGQLRVGMYIDLDLGWMAHPFPRSSFKITSEKQIETVRGLGLKRVRLIPGKSDPAELATPLAGIESVPSQALAAPVDIEIRRPPMLRSELIASQQRSLLVCERQFGEANRLYQAVLEQLSTQPQMALAQCHGLVNGMVGEVSDHGETAIRLLSSGMGDRSTMHPVNVTVISLLLGRALGLGDDDLMDLGLAALLHDIGKPRLAVRMRWLEEDVTTPEHKAYQEHVAHGVALARGLALSDNALQAIAQHHELVDGSGFPARIKGDSLSLTGKILALVNRYDNLCNPDQLAATLTPHDALALLYTRFKPGFDQQVLDAFVRMMGVYPPGSLVQLGDERYAMVVSVNASRPLKPRVLVHEPAVPKHEALILDLEQAPEISIQKSLKLGSLPKEAMDYLLPRQRFCYFFERAVDPGFAEAKT